MMVMQEHWLMMLVKKGVGASHGDNTAVDIGAACDDLISGLKQDLLPQQDLLLLFTVVIC